jgi:hypothetical protein
MLQVDGIDLSMLYESIMPMKQLQGEVENWDPDVMLEVLKQEMQEEKDRRVSIDPCIWLLLRIAVAARAFAPVSGVRCFRA